MYYLAYCGMLDELMRIKDGLKKAKDEDPVKERQKIIQEAVDKLRESIFNLNNAIEGKFK